MLTSKQRAILRGKGSGEELSGGEFINQIA